MYYGVLPNPEYTRFSEIWLEKSKIKLQDDLSGFVDYEEEFNVIEYSNRGLQTNYKKSLSDPMNKNKDDLITYFNIGLDNQATEYTRTHFTLIELLKD